MRSDASLLMTRMHPCLSWLLRYFLSVVPHRMLALFALLAFAAFALSSVLFEGMCENTRKPTTSTHNYLISRESVL